MNDQSHAYLIQARSDLEVFDLLLHADRNRIPECHPLHYLQMATEKLSKAIHLRMSPDYDPYTHVSFTNIPYLIKRRDVAERLGWMDFKAFQRFMNTAAPIFLEIEWLHPNVGSSSATGPNVEYPWLGRDDAGNRAWIVPASHHFGLLMRIRDDQRVRQVLDLVKAIIHRFDHVFPRHTDLRSIKL